jgi:hypothetical protein
MTDQNIELESRFHRRPIKKAGWWFWATPGPTRSSLP